MLHNFLTIVDLEKKIIGINWISDKRGHHKKHFKL